MVLANVTQIIRQKVSKLLLLTSIVFITMTTGCLRYAMAIINSEPSSIIDYAPKNFVEKAESPFFYSIGNELRFNDHIDKNDKVLFNAPKLLVIPSPNSEWALVVSKNVLWLIKNDGSSPVHITPVDNLRMGRASGIKFFRYTEIQWSEDSSSFYLIKDETYNSVGSQLFSIHGELTEYNIATRQMRKVLTPFRAFKYFISKENGVFFHEANDKGDVILMVGESNKSAVVTEISPKGFRAANVTTSFNAAPFYTFSEGEYSYEILPTKNVIFEVEGQNPRIGSISIRGKRIISVIEGKGVNGRYMGFELHNSGLLPGERYFVLNLRTGSYYGQLLFDLMTGDYKTLPEDTKIYRNINTHNFSGWTITKDGIMVNPSHKKQKVSWD